MIEYFQYKPSHLQEIVSLISQELSEPYSIYTYKYFLTNWPEACFIAQDSSKLVGVVISRITCVRDKQRGYIAMLAVDRNYRMNGIGSQLVKKTVQQMKGMGADEIVLETEVCNQSATRLYMKQGFFKDKYLLKYYLNGQDAFRLKLFF